MFFSRLGDMAGAGLFQGIHNNKFVRSTRRAKSHRVPPQRPTNNHKAQTLPGALVLAVFYFYRTQSSGCVESLGISLKQPTRHHLDLVARPPPPVCAPLQKWHECQLWGQEIPGRVRGSASLFFSGRKEEQATETDHTSFRRQRDGAKTGGLSAVPLTCSRISR